MRIQARSSSSRLDPNAAAISSATFSVYRTMSRSPMVLYAMALVAIGGHQLLAGGHVELRRRARHEDAHRGMSNAQVVSNHLVVMPQRGISNDLPFAQAQTLDAWRVGRILPGHYVAPAVAFETIDERPASVDQRPPAEQALARVLAPMPPRLLDVEHRLAQPLDGLRFLGFALGMMHFAIGRKHRCSRAEDGERASRGTRESAAQAGSRREMRGDPSPARDGSARRPPDLRPTRVQAAPPAGRLGRGDPDGIVHPELLRVALHQLVFFEMARFAHHLAGRLAGAGEKGADLDLRRHAAKYGGVKPGQLFRHPQHLRLQNSRSITYAVMKLEGTDTEPAI